MRSSQPLPLYDAHIIVRINRWCCRVTKRMLLDSKAYMYTLIRCDRSFEFSCKEGNRALVVFAYLRMIPGQIKQATSTYLCEIVVQMENLLNK